MTISLTPLPFLRIGFSILGLGVAFSIWTGGSAPPSGWAMTAGLLALVATQCLGEGLVRVASARAAAPCGTSNRDRQ